MVPSVRGRERLAVGAGLIAAGTSAAMLAGAIAAVLVASLWSMTIDVAPALDEVDRTTVTAGLVAAGLVLDAIVLITGRPRPITLGRQVPRQWIELMDARVVSVLFGARLGIGPLTILSTWGWWAATIASALLGVLPAVIVGAAFGIVRLVVVVGVSVAVGRNHASWFSALRARQRRGWRVLNVAGLICLVSVATVGCSAGAGASDSLGGAAPTDTASTEWVTPQAPETETETGTATTVTEAPTETTVAVRSAELEDIVRDQTTLVATTPEGDATDWRSDPDVLAVVLTREIDGFGVIEDPGADRYLDLRAAADIQPDPTEEIALLETRGFEGGWTRAFRNATNDVAVTSVYQFQDAAEAEFYLEDGLITIGGYGGSFFDFEHLPGVRGFAQTFDDGDEELVSIGAAFQAGPRWFLTYIVGSPQTVSPNTLAPIIEAQIAEAQSGSSASSERATQSVRSP